MGSARSLTAPQLICAAFGPAGAAWQAGGAPGTA